MTIKSVLGPVAVKGCVYLLFQLENLCSLTFCAFSTPVVELVSLALHGIPQRPELTGRTRPDYCCNVILVIIVTRPMPPYGRQGLAGSWGMDTVRRVHFGVFSTSQPTSFDPKNVTSQTRGPNRPFRCLDYFRGIVTPVA